MCTSITESILSMPNPFLAVTKLVSTVSEASAQLFVPKAKPAFMPGPTVGCTITHHPIAEGSDGKRTQRPAQVIYGRVRWVTPRVIIEWQTKQGTSKENFAIYRGNSINWREARLLDLSIFTTTINQQNDMITYRVVDTTVHASTLYYYWIINLRIKDGEQRFGPYRVATEE